MKLTQTLFEWVFTSAFLILAVLALRALLGRRVSAGLRYALWAVVLVRLLVPVQLFTTPVAGTSVLRETGVEQWVSPPDLQPDPVPAVSAAPVPAPTELPGGTVIVYQPATPPVTVTAEPLPVLRALGWLWLAGSAGAAAAFLISNLTFARRLGRVRRPLEGADCPLPVYIADSLPSPCLFGLFRSAVYVTEETAQSPAMLRHVLAHEYTHFRHGDHVWNALRSAALILHWWNPLVWLAAALSRRDGELACDEGALKRLGDGERVAYGRTLVALITARPRPGDLFRCATTMTGEQKSVFDRVTRIAKAPKRWLWAAVAAVAVTVLACVCAFGRAEEPDAPPAAGVTADLTFSLETGSDGSSYVRMDGTVDGVELTRGAFWYPDWWQGDQMTPELTMVYPPFTDGIEGHISVNWEGASGGPEITLSTQLTALLSSQSNIGYWVFTVNLDTGTVQKQQMPLDSPAEGETRFYPRSISDEEAVRAARIAAKLLTAGEDYYNNHKNDVEDLYAAMPELFAKVMRGESKFVLYKNEPPISIDEVPALIDPNDEYMCFQRYTVVDMLGGLGSNKTPQVLLYVSGTSGDMAGYLLLWDEDGQVHGEIFGRYAWRNRWFIDLKTDGTFVCTDSMGGHDWMSISRLWPTAAGSWSSLYSEAVWRGLDSSGNEIDLESFMIIDQELDEAGFEQAMEAQRAKPDVTWYALPLKDLDAPAPTHPLLSGLTYTLDEYGVSLAITGLDCESAYWYASRTDHNNGGMTEPSLEITRPRVLGEAFSNAYYTVRAQYLDGQLQMFATENSPGTPGLRDFRVDLATGAVTEREIDPSVWQGKNPVPSDEVLLRAAQTLAWLMENASNFYTSSLPAPEEGPLPFDTPMKLMFASGAGAWDTLLTLHPDGSFEGNYHDTDAGDSGDGYQSTEYVCRFHGRFGDIRQVTNASWSLTLAELVLDTGRPIGEEWIETVSTPEGSYNQRYISSGPYGFDTADGGPLEPGAQFMLYTPEARGYRPTDELYEMRESENYDSVMFQFWTWWPRKGAWAPDGTLGCYGLCSMETGRGFFDLHAWGIA